MTTLLLTPRAKADLDDIWIFNVERWGEERTERYITELWHGIKRFAEDIRRGQPCDDIRPGYIKYAVGSHIVFARIADDTLVVVRILHQRMDFDRHL
ncbi:MAG: type II toxin-antitoxin system RelE/ParE family toxin [Hyphomicrobiaceae bacterium]|nr:type II toxin-antitoxin system RelE/ParE family toxin [Hyphomicrobiaceae bacterium]